jgi:hypothetical protein
MVGDSLSAVVLAQKLFRRGINVQPVTYPAVPAKASRLRFFLTAMHTQSDIECALDTTAEELETLPDTLRALQLLDIEKTGAPAEMNGDIEKLFSS